MGGWGIISGSNERRLGSEGVVKVKKYRVQLTEEEQQELRVLVSKGRAAAYKQTHARILLLSNEGCQGGAHERRGD